MVPVCGVGFQNALGALAPPEVAVQLTWDGGIRVNGAGCGFLQARASRSEARAVPEWLVVGIEISLMQTETDPGANPDVTALHERPPRTKVDRPFLPTFRLLSWCSYVAPPSDCV